MMHHGFTLAFPHDFEYRVSARRPAYGDTIHARGALWTVTEVHGKRYVLRQVIAELAAQRGTTVDCA